MEFLYPAFEKLEHMISNILIFIGAYEVSFKTLSSFMVINLVLCIIANIFNKNSNKSFRLSILQKLLIFINIGVATSIDKLTGGHDMHNLIIYFFIGKEGLEILHYSSKFGVEYPDSIRRILEQFTREKQRDSYHERVRSHEAEETEKHGVKKHGVRSHEFDETEKQRVRSHELDETKQIESEHRDKSHDINNE